MDTHIGVYASFTGLDANEYDEANYVNPDLVYIEKLKRRKRLFLPQGPSWPPTRSPLFRGPSFTHNISPGRNQIESVFIATNASKAMIQILWINNARKDPFSMVFDQPILGCKPGLWVGPSGILAYQEMAHRPGVTGEQFHSFMTSHAAIPPNPNRGHPITIPPLHTPNFNLCDHGSHEARSWMIHDCALHLGPCCGDARCSAERGENHDNCHVDCMDQS